MHVKFIDFYINYLKNHTNDNFLLTNNVKLYMLKVRVDKLDVGNKV